MAATRSRGVTLLATLLVASPLVQWAYVSTVSLFTILEPPFTASRGIPLAMQLFFSPGNVVTVALGAGLLRRSEWTRRIARAVFLLAVAISVWLIGVQVTTWRFDSSVLLALLSLALSAVCLWYFGRASVRDEFRPRERDGASFEVVPAKTAAPYPRAVILAACAESILGLAATFLLAHLHTAFGAWPLLDFGPGIGVAEADEFLRQLLFVAFALFLAPHALTTYASIGILLGRDMTVTARRYAAIACWTVVAAALVAAWLATSVGFAFDVRSVRLILLFCSISLAWHGGFLYILARYRSSR